MKPAPTTKTYDRAKELRIKRKERLASSDHFGAMLQRKRIDACMSNAELFVETGISAAALFRYERDPDARLSTKNLIAIAKALGTTAQNLITEYETSTKN